MLLSAEALHDIHIGFAWRMGSAPGIIDASKRATLALRTVIRMSAFT